jgi:2-oxoglutarate ferredoxin oxidoreductase subunit gamma
MTTALKKPDGRIPQLIKCAGFGGQGILALGEIIAIAAMRSGLNVSWLPSYGPESRGGTCNCDVILSEHDIAAPLVESPNVAFIFNQPSLDKFEPQVRPGGLLFYDTSLARLDAERDSLRYLGVAFTTIAMSLGSERIANMVALGAYLGALEILDRKSAVDAMKEKFQGKEAFFSMNEKAIVAGIDAVQAPV